MTTAKSIANIESTNISVEYFGDSVIEEFIASRKPSPNTAKTYKNCVRQLLKYFAANGITAPTTADVDNFVNGLRAAKKSDSTIRLYSTTTKLFFAYLGKHGIYADVAAECSRLKLRKATTHKKKSLSDSQAKKLLAAVKGDDEQSKRNRAIIALCLTCGLRTIEVARATVGDFKDNGAFWTLDVVGKGHLTTDESVKVAKPVAELINQYLAIRGVVEDSEPLFTSTSNNTAKYGNSFSAQSVGKMIKRYMKAAGIADKKITAHSTRHYAATTAIKSGVDVREVAAMLRHTSIVITSVYLHDLSLETRRAELAVADKLFCA